MGISFHFSDICSLRLDFESFQLAGPSVTDTEDPVKLSEPFGGVCDTDVFTVDAVGSAAIPLICGANQGQHSNCAFLAR